MYGVSKLDQRVTDNQPLVNPNMLLNVNVHGVSFLCHCFVAYFEFQGQLGLSFLVFFELLSWLSFNYQFGLWVFGFD